ncbi:MAG: HD-GYP domain-containing protein [Desulfotomaculales bacterium]
MKRHPALGAELVEKRVLQRNSSFDLTLGEEKTICTAVLSHREKWDGSGYPNGLKGEEIPLAARIIAVADAYDAMNSERPYRKVMSRGDTLREIMRCAGNQFDTEVAEALVKLLVDNTTLGMLCDKR